MSAEWIYTAVLCAASLSMVMSLLLYLLAGSGLFDLLVEHRDEKAERRQEAAARAQETRDRADRQNEAWLREDPYGMYGDFPPVHVDLT